MTIDDLRAAAKNVTPSSNVSLVTLSPPVQAMYGKSILQIDMLDIDDFMARNMDTRRWFKVSDLRPVS